MSLTVNYVLTPVFTSVEPAQTNDKFPIPPRSLTNLVRGGWWMTRVLVLAFIVAFLSLASVSEARASVFNHNERLVGGASPVNIPWDYNVTGGPTAPNPVPVGTGVQIVYGIGVYTGNTNPVTVNISLPTGYSYTSMRCLRFNGPSNPPTPATAGIQFTAGCTLPNVSLGALAAANDKVIIVFDGYFTQAGAYSASFVPAGGALGTSNETSTLNMTSSISNLPVDIGIAKWVKPKTTGSFGPTATQAIIPPGTLTYKLRVTNNSAVDPLYHTTDVYLGPLLRLNDTFSAPGSPQDIQLNIALQAFQCTSSALSVPCPTMPGTPSNSLFPSQTWTLLPPIMYPTTSNGFLPAGGWFEITFDAVISTPSTCSPNHNNKLNNGATLTYSNGSATISDQNPANNTTIVTSASLPVPGLPTVCQPPPTILVTKTKLVTGNWNAPAFTYKITVKNTSTTTLTGLALTDFVTSSTSTPPFTATPSSVNCSACSTAPTLYTSVINPGASSPLFTAAFQPLAANATVTIQYNVNYAAPCADYATPGTITNFAYVNGPATGSSQVSDAMAALPICPFQVTKTITTQPPTFSSFPATFGFQVKFKNTSPTQTHHVGTLIDSISIDNGNYGNIPISYNFACTASGVTGISALTGSSTGTMQANNPIWAGVKLIDFSSAAGATFAPLGTLTCQVNLTMQQPPTNDSKCEGDGLANFRNNAFMAVGYPYNTNLPQTPAFYASVVKPLPKCMSIVVGKSPSANVIAGQPMTFTLTMKNAGNNNTPGGMNMVDNVPSGITGFTVTGWSCSPSTACSPSSGSAGNSLNIALNSIAGGAITTITVNAIAPSAPGVVCNTDKVTFNPFPALTYFEGNMAVLTTASACVQVNAPPPSPPTLLKSFSPPVVGLGQPVYVTFTINNSAGSGPQTGLTFSDALPNPPFTTSALVSNSCNGSAIANGNILSLVNGSLPAGPSTCTVVFKMAPPTACGVFTNNKKNIHESQGLDVSGVKADLTVHCEPVKVELQKSVVNVSANFAGTFNFNVSCTAPGGATTSSIKVIPFSASDPLGPYKGGLLAKTKTILIGTLAVGTTCTVTEVPPMPTPPAGCSWQPPVYMGTGGGTITVTSPGPMKVTVANTLNCNTKGGGVIPND